MKRSKRFRNGETVGAMAKSPYSCRPMVVAVGEIRGSQRDRDGRLSYLVSGYEGVRFYSGHELVRMTGGELRKALNPQLSRTSQARGSKGNRSAGPTLPAPSSSVRTEHWEIGGVLQPVKIRRV